MNYNDKELEKTMAFYKYENFQTDFFESLEYERLLDIMTRDFSLNHDELKFQNCSNMEILKSGGYVIEKHMGNIDLNVPCIFNDDDLSMKLFENFGFNFSLKMYDTVIDYIKNNIEFVKVTNIPLTIVSTEKRNGYALNYSFYDNADLDNSFFEKMPICATGIFVLGPSDAMAKTIYVHEMTHVLVNKSKGNVLNFMHGEVLPIFMEKVAALDLDDSLNLLYCINNQRLLNLRKAMITMLFEDSNLIDKLYIVSTLLSESLFDVYEKASLKDKKNIDKSIGGVFMGETVLEDVLNKYEINLENGVNITSKHVKKLRLKL